MDNVGFLGPPLASRMTPSWPYYVYFMTTQWHVEGWSLGLLYMGEGLVFGRVVVSAIFIGKCLEGV